MRTNRIINQGESVSQAGISGLSSLEWCEQEMARPGLEQWRDVAIAAVRTGG